jgi:hypothetical protein
MMTDQTSEPPPPNGMPPGEMLDIAVPEALEEMAAIIIRMSAKRSDVIESQRPRLPMIEGQPVASQSPDMAFVYGGWFAMRVLIRRLGYQYSDLSLEVEKRLRDPAIADKCLRWVEWFETAMAGTEGK